MKNITLISVNEHVWFRGRIRNQTTWFQMRGKQQHFFKQISGNKIKRITDKKEKQDLTWYYQRYYPNGDRI